MGKTRSSRRLRKYKSRTKRGGGLRYYISPQKLSFKQAKEAGPAWEFQTYIVNLVNNSPDDIPSLYADLNQLDKDILRRCIIEGLKTNRITNDKIRNLHRSEIN